MATARCKKTALIVPAPPTTNTCDGGRVGVDASPVFALSTRGVWFGRPPARDPVAHSHIDRPELKTTRLNFTVHAHRLLHRERLLCFVKRHTPPKKAERRSKSPPPLRGPIAPIAPAPGRNTGAYFCVPSPARPAGRGPATGSRGPERAGTGFFAPPLSPCLSLSHPLSHHRGLTFPFFPFLLSADRRERPPPRKGRPISRQALSVRPPRVPRRRPLGASTGGRRERGAEAS